MRSAERQRSRARHERTRSADLRRTIIGPTREQQLFARLETLALCGFEDRSALFVGEAIRSGELDRGEQAQIIRWSAGATRGRERVEQPGRVFGLALQKLFTQRGDSHRGLWQDRESLRDRVCIRELGFVPLGLPSV